MLRRTQGSASSRLLSKYTSRSRLQQQILQKSETSAVDPDSLKSDPDKDPAFQVNPDPDTDPGFWRPKTEEKNTAENFFYLIAIYLFLGLH
jgi:hypothetical protein